MDLHKYIWDLKQNGICPPHIETSSWGRWHLVSCYKEKSDRLISESVNMGVDVDPKVAFLKALTEFSERALAKSSSDNAAKATHRSDGFAAYPINDGEKNMALECAKENALNEATERYLWATWWDGSDQVKFQIVDPLETELKTDLQNLFEFFRLRSLREIQIDESTGTYRLSILLAETDQGGFVTGGSCSKVSEPMKRRVPAFGELLRHLFVVYKMRASGYVPKSFYERRLHGFGFGQWRSSVLDRLNTNGERLIELPQLAINKEIEHHAMDVIRIYRCLYQNQPPFMGGDLERLCI